MERLEVLKTYKIYIGGQFPRTESGRYYALKTKGSGLRKRLPLVPQRLQKRSGGSTRGLWWLEYPEPF